MDTVNNYYHSNVNIKILDIKDSMKVKIFKKVFIVILLLVAINVMKVMLHYLYTEKMMFVYIVIIIKMII